MIFRQEMVDAILEGRKTVTRRPVKFKNEMPPGPPGPVKVEQPCRYEVGRIYALQPGRGQKAVARIRILDVRRGLLAGVDADEARVEGFPSVVHFRRYWCRLYGLPRFPSTQRVDRIEFELVEITTG